MQYGIRVPEILMPGAQYNLEKWAVVACDQYTSQPEYWEEAEKLIGGEPSTLELIYPEAWLNQGDARIERINKAMDAYAADVLTRAVRGFVLVERTIATGKRLGLMAEFDLEEYDFSVGSKSLIRATEGTILSRIPPRVKIRENAPLELPHIMMLADDPEKTLIEPLYAQRDKMEKLCDFELMLGGGHIRTWRVPEEISLDAAVEGLYNRSEGLLWAVGDGNHSLATARQCWLNMRSSIPEDERASHPARFALAEIVNLHDPALVFEPIHRYMPESDGQALLDDFAAWLNARGMQLVPAEAGMFTLVAGGEKRSYAIENLDRPLPLSALQEYLDGVEGLELDYVHGEEALCSLCDRAGAGILLPAIDKNTLFASVRALGSLPRKAFSMGEAPEKRYYLEARRIRK